MSEPSEQQSLTPTADPADGLSGLSKTAKQRERNRMRQQRRRQKKAAAKKQSNDAGGQQQHGEEHQGSHEEQKKHQDDQPKATQAENRDDRQQQKKPAKKNNLKRNLKRKRQDPAGDDGQKEESIQSLPAFQQSNREQHIPSTEQLKTLQWPCNTPSRNPYVPKSEEEAMVEILFERNGKKERGMLKDKPPHVAKTFFRKLPQHAPSMTVPGLCSLRRHHIKLHFPNKTMPQCGLGSIQNINASAKRFEQAIQQFLISQHVPFQTEKDLKQQQTREHGRVVATPDFTFPNPVELGFGNTTTAINWIEVKMYYGASTIPHGGAGAVGTLLATAKKYVHHFGNGAMVFMMGCGEGLAADLLEVGVTCLTIDERCAVKIDLRPVHEHQRTWCANEQGEILP